VSRESLRRRSRLIINVLQVRAHGSWIRAYAGPPLRLLLFDCLRPYDFSYSTASAPTTSPIRLPPPLQLRLFDRYLLVDRAQIDAFAFANDSRADVDEHGAQVEDAEEHERGVAVESVGCVL
jgi:hypothetical protein